MAFTPVIGIGGYAGFRVLEQIAPRQREAFDRSPDIQRNIEYFRANISKAVTAEDLVADRKLLAVALGAFGLGEEIDKRAFVRRIIESSTTEERSLVNRINDPRYKELTKAFGYGDLSGGSNVLRESFREDIIARYKALEFERAVGEGDPDFRLALNFKREIVKIASGENADRVGWLQVLGQRPLRELLSTALQIPDEIAQLDIDQQVKIFEERAAKFFGDRSAAVFKDPDVVDQTLRRFFLNQQVKAGPSPLTPGFAALTLLQNSALGGVGGANLILSQL